MAIIKLLYKMSIVYKLQIVCETSKITLMYILGLLFDSQEKYAIPHYCSHLFGRKAQEDANSIFKYLCKMSNAEFLETYVIDLCSIFFYLLLGLISIPQISSSKCSRWN